MNRLVQWAERDRPVRRDLLLLAVCLFLTFGTSLVAGLITDDIILVKNARDAPWTFEGLSRSFHLATADVTDGWMPPQIADFKLSFFRPVYMASLKLDILLWGDWYPGYHLTNLLLHLIVVFLVYFWMGDFGLNQRGRFLGALLYVAYIPNQLSVAWIAGRTEIIAAVFLLTSVLFLGRFHRERRALDYVISLCAAVLALGSKENAVMIPFVHCAAAVFLYPPKDAFWRGMKARALAITPFFLLLPPYFALRTWALGGFPLPPRGFYYHPVADPDFAPFLITKLYHTVLALVFQVPALMVPAVLERSMPTLIAGSLLALITAVTLVLWVKPPIRYFLLVWMGLILAPTLPIGLNPVYYYLCAPAMAVVYVLLYRHFSQSSEPKHARAARALLTVALVLGFVVNFSFGLAFAASGELNRRVAENAKDLLADYPAVEVVYLLDIPPNGTHFLVPELRLLDERFEAVEFRVLGLGTHLFLPRESRITQLDGHRFEMEAAEGTYFTTGIEQIALSKDLLDFHEGFKAEHPDYSFTFTSVVPHLDARDEPGFFKALRSHYRLPPREQMGVQSIEYRFRDPLASESHLFLRVTGQTVEKLTFASSKDISRDPDSED